MYSMYKLTPNKKEIEMAQLFNEIEESYTIRSTMNYDQFKLVECNRPVTMKQVNHVMNEIMRVNLTKENPIKVSSDYEVLDGQHTLLACKKLEIPVYYMFTEMQKTDIGSFNSVGKAWGYADYLNFYVSQGHEQYKIFQTFVKRYPFAITTLITILTGNNTHAVFTDFKLGQLKISQSLDHIEDILSKIVDFKPHSESTFRHRAFIKAYTEQALTHPDFSHKKFLHKVELAPQLFTKQRNNKDYLRMIEDIYNRNNQPGTKDLRLW